MKMKIGHLQNRNEAETLNSFLVNCRDTPYLSTGVTRAHMLFRDGKGPIYPISPSVKKLSFKHEIQIIA